MSKYLIKPGWVYSKNDGDKHYITGPCLADLYAVSDYKICNCKMLRQQCRCDPEDNMIHLYPSHNGNYAAPEA